MGYAKQYAVTITASGDDVETAITKQQEEFDAAYDIMTDIATWYQSSTAPSSPFEGMKWLDTTDGYVLKSYESSAWVKVATLSTASSKLVPKRQAVLCGHVDSSTYLPDSIIIGSGLSLNLVATDTSFIMAFAAGFDEDSGAVDYIASFTEDVTAAWSSLPASSTLYIMVSRATDGTLTRSYSTLKPVYQKSAPSSPSTGQYWFDLVNWEMKYYSGSAWVTKQVLFVGECVTGASSVTSFTQYAYYTSPAAEPAGVQGSYKNLKIVNGSTASSQIVVTADQLMLFDSNNSAYLATDVNVTISSSASGKNGLDTGSLAASEWYSIWIIYNGDTIKGLISLDETSPTLPSGYTYYARVGWTKTDSDSNLLQLVQYGNEVHFKVTKLAFVKTDADGVARLISSGAVGTWSATTPTYSAVSVSDFIPTTAHIIKLIVATAGSDNYNALIAPNQYYGGNYMYVSSSTGYRITPPISGLSHGEIVLESDYIYVACQYNIYILLDGWIDNL